jgi:LysM repeat protein
MRLVLFLISIFVFSSSFASGQITRKEYIDTYKDLAIKEMKRTGIPASITLAQGILESANGNSRLAQKANNHFGIKCHSSWKGKTIRKDDDKKNECFRKYKSAYDSYMDHSNFLTRGKRYAFLFDYKTTDYKKWAKGLKKAGYATSRTYATRLIQIIEDYKLYKYDSNKYEAIASNKPETKEKKKKKTKKTKLRLSSEDYAVQLGRVVKENNRVTYIIAKKGDSYTKLTDEFQMLRFELYKYNDVKKGAKIKQGQKIYLKPKRNKAEKGHDYHTIKKGDTLYSISQKYGVKLKKLLKRNGLSKNQKLKEGTKIRLR